MHKEGVLSHAVFIGHKGGLTKGHGGHVLQGPKPSGAPTQDMRRKNYPKYRGNFCLLEITFI